MKEKFEWKYYVHGDWKKGTQGRTFKNQKWAKKYAEKIGSTVLSYIHHPLLDEF